MLILNGKRFAANDKEFIDSLFTGSTTCVGYYRVNKKSISIMDQQKNKVGVIANNVLATATKQGKGYWYCYATPDIVGEYSSHMQEVEEVREAMGLIKSG